MKRLPGTKLIGCLIVVVLVGAIGVYTLISSKAASTGTITLIVSDTSSGSLVPAGEAYVSLSITGAGGPLCSNMDGLTDGNGRITFNGCSIGTPYAVTFITFKAGWYTVAANSDVKTGTQLGIGPGGSLTSFIKATPVDNDSDGVPNKSDQCVNNAGPASNNGCPVASTPTPAAPTPAAPTAPSNTTKAPSSSPSSTTKKSSQSTATAKTTSPPVVAATSGDTTPPSSPANLIVSQIDDGIFMSWDDASDNVGVTGYNIERSSDGENWSKIADNIGDSFYTDSDVVSGTYYYKVQAKDAAGNLSEGIIEDIDLASGKSSSNSKTKTTTPAAKKSNSNLAGVSIAVLLVLGLLGGGFWLLRRKMGGSSNTDPYSYDVASMSPNPLPSATVMPGPSLLPPNQPTPSQPTYNTGAPAQHTSVSLKDMVMEEMNKHGQNLPPTPPQPQA